jgi:hypothetical protein
MLEMRRIHPLMPSLILGMLAVPAVVVAQEGGGARPREQGQRAEPEALTAPIAASAPARKEGAPYPPSEVIRGVEWAPPETIRRAAEGSDNWPLTWADDDALYSAYGDGRGFLPGTEEKLGLGFARILGGPADFQGVNIRSKTGERRGEGADSPKASGMICVNGILYMLVRNVGNSQVVWSDDHAANWNWCDWRFETSFGAPTFLNFGRNNAGRRDDFVYIYSHDNGSAYVPADRMVLARVPLDRIRDRRAYEFLESLDDVGRPTWTRNIHDRGAVFTSPERCWRSGITYNAGLKRYLWCQILPFSTDPRGPRFQGGFGIYEAPEPWGPWRTAFYTETWDVGPGETGSFPTKWMSPDGRTCYLVFSGNDSFSVRRARLHIDERALP